MHNRRPSIGARVLTSILLATQSIFAGTSTLSAHSIYPASQGAPRTEIRLFGYPGDYVGGLRPWSYECPFGWGVRTYDASGDGIPDEIYISYGVWLFTFFAGATGRNLTPGVFPQVVRAGYTPPGFAAMDVSGDGRGCNELSGNFTILDATYDYVHRDSNGNPSVLSFAVTFEQHCESPDSSPFVGTILYNSTAVPDASAPTVTDVRLSKAKLRRDGVHAVTISWDASDDDQIAGFAIVITEGDRLLGGPKGVIAADARSYTWTPGSDLTATVAGTLHVYAVDRSNNVGEAIYESPIIVK